MQNKSFFIYLIFFTAEVFVLFMLLPLVSLKWYIALAIHCVIALLATIWISKHHYSKIKSKNSLFVVLLFVVILFTPVFNAIMLWLLDIKDVLRTSYKRKTQAGEIAIDSQQIFDYLEESKLSSHSNKSKNTHSLLSTLNDEDYLKLLIASRHLPDKEAYILLQKALESPFESARLMAFSLKGKLEQRLHDTLQKNLALLKTLPENKQAEQHLVVAKEYLHLLDIGVSSKDKEQLLQEATDHCVRAIKINKKSAYPYLILSKIFSYQGKIKRSSQVKKIAYSLQNY